MIAKATSEVFNEFMDPLRLQYGAPCGYKAMRESLARFILKEEKCDEDIKLSHENIFITGGNSAGNV